MNAYDVGDMVRLSVTFKNNVAVATDPTTIRLKYKSGPDGAVTTLVYGTDAALVRGGSGVYYADLIMDTEGELFYRWEGEGTVHQSVEASLLVAESAIL